MFYFIRKSSISVTILNFLNPCFTCTPNFRSPREPRIFWRSILCSRRPSQNVFKKAFPGHEAGPPTYQISQKNAKTFNACLTACWMSFSTETQQHRSTCHFSQMPPQDWNMTYMCLQRRFQPQIAMGLQIVICLLKFGQSWQVLSSCVKTGQHAEQRLTLSSDERLKTTRD